MLTIKQERENNMYLNKREAEIIGTFMDVEDDFKGKKLILKWNNGTATKQQKEWIENGHWKD